MRRPQGTSRGKAAQCECGLAQRARLQRFLRLHVFRRAVTVQSWRRGSGACDTCGFPLLVDALTSRRRHWDRQCAGTAVRQLGAPTMHLYKCTHHAWARQQPRPQPIPDVRLNMPTSMHRAHVRLLVLLKRVHKQLMVGFAVDQCVYLCA